MDIGRLQKCEKTLDLAIAHLKSEGVGGFFRYRDLIRAYFFIGDDLLNDFLNIIPIEEMWDFQRFLRFISSYSGTINDVFINGIEECPKQTALLRMERLRELIHGAISENAPSADIRIHSGNTVTVFYSWQSHKPEQYYKSLIERAIQTAIERLNRKNGWRLSLDKDTLNAPGSPNIVETTLKKIDASAVFIADVSINAASENRSFPNPNVLFELGYAWKAKGYGRVILVFNEDSGSSAELPFDFRGNKALKYRCSAETDLSDAEKDLARKLENEIELALSAE